MLVDENINITYLRSDRITLDNIQPVISGIENGKTYCEAQTVTVDEKYVDTVTVNGTVVTLDADGGFVLHPTNGEQKIVVTDKSGNNAEMTVTVNNGHTFGEWVSDNDGKHTRKCIVDGCDAFETEIAQAAMPPVPKRRYVMSAVKPTENLTEQTTRAVYRSGRQEPLLITNKNGTAVVL